MKYMITWHERSMGSAADYEGLQKRIMAVFRKWEIPESVKVHHFLVRAGDWGGFMLVETDDFAAMHKMTTTWAAFEFRVDPVLDIQDAACEGKLGCWDFRSSALAQPGAHSESRPPGRVRKSFSRADHSPRSCTALEQRREHPMLLQNPCLP